MKKYTSFLLLLFSIIVHSQAYDIPQKFEAKRGFVQNIDYENNELLVNFVADKQITKELIRIIASTQFSTTNKTLLTFKDIQSNDEIIIDGQYYKEDRYAEATTITIVERKVKPIKNGLIDFILEDYAFVDGNKIKIMPGKVIKGKKNSGYEDKSFTSLKELKQGDFATLSGKYNRDGYYLVEDLIFEPNNDSEFDKSADTLDNIEYNKFIDLWPDKAKRVKLFSTEIEGIGKIYNDAKVQDYIQNLGDKLVPNHIKKNKSFLFIVVENPIQNANIRANGLAYIYTGLLKSVENEAQLAAILSHEIAHVIYEHLSNEAEENLKAKTGKKGVSLFEKGLRKTLDPNKDKNKEVIYQNLEDLTKLTTAIIDKRLSTYSVDQEIQADRVGLSLMILAGYDPREAPLFWKNNFARYGETKVPKENEVISFSQFATDKLLEEKPKTETSKPETKGKQKQQTDLTKISSSLTEITAWKSKNYRAESYKTHQNSIKRFEDLNRLISMYWNDEEMLKNVTKGVESYKEILKILNAKKIEKKGK